MTAIPFPADPQRRQSSTLLIVAVTAAVTFVLTVALVVGGLAVLASTGPSGQERFEQICTDIGGRGC